VSPEGRIGVRIVGCRFGGIRRRIARGSGAVGVGVAVGVNVDVGVRIGVPATTGGAVRGRV
jgi:hypothetical protein